MGDWLIAKTLNKCFYAPAYFSRFTSLIQTLHSQVMMGSISSVISLKQSVDKNEEIIPCRWNSQLLNTGVLNGTMHFACQYQFPFSTSTPLCIISWCQVKQLFLHLSDGQAALNNGPSFFFLFSHDACLPASPPERSSPVEFECMHYIHACSLLSSERGGIAAHLHHVLPQKSPRSKIATNWRCTRFKREWTRKSDSLHNWPKPNRVLWPSTDPLWCPYNMQTFLHICSIYACIMKMPKLGKWEHLMISVRIKNLSHGFLPIDKNEWNFI